MKPTITWVVLADARSAQIVRNTGPGKGFEEVPGKLYEASPPTEYADEPGQGHSSHGPGRTSKTRRDPKSLAAAAFAETIAAELAESHRRGSFDRLILVAGPHMLGALRAALAEPVRTSLHAEVDKDLTGVEIRDLPGHLADIIAA